MLATLMWRLNLRLNHLQCTFSFLSLRVSFKSAGALSIVELQKTQHLGYLWLIVGLSKVELMKLRDAPTCSFTYLIFKGCVTPNDME
jgi:hypothetical protein